METAPPRRQSDRGFPFRAILAVMIIAGLLAGIAIPLYLNQKKQSHDTATKSDVNAIADAIVGYIASNQSLPTLSVTGTSVMVAGELSGELAPGVVLGPLTGTTVDDWCIDATHPNGDRAKTQGYKFTQTEGKVEEGKCT